MQNHLAFRPVSLPSRSGLTFAPDAADRPFPGVPREDADHQFVAMLDAYRDSGGLVRTHEVLALSRRCAGPDAATLAGCVAQREVISFEWQTLTWLPLFQFRRADMRPQPGLVQVLAELTPVCDPWELANWFIQPNPWLADCTPVDTLLADLPALLNAARAERFVANG